jgi:hypothetical protein
MDESIDKDESPALKQPGFYFSVICFEWVSESVAVAFDGLRATSISLESFYAA